MARPHSIELPARNQIDKAGKLLRDYVAGRLLDADPDKIDKAIQTVTLFREAHGYPMTKVRLGLASMVNTEQIDAAVSQRHKRVPRIVRKLIRMHGTALVRLEDIGGCRVVVPSAFDMDALCRRIRKNWHRQFGRPERDYIADPKSMGYRARHFVVVRDGRSIEVQVRTAGQQRWADHVESLDSRHKLNLKDEQGPEALKEYLALAGEMIYRREWGLEPDFDLIARYREAVAIVAAEGYVGA